MGARALKMRQLCLDALVEEGDVDFDWRLSFPDFAGKALTTARRLVSSAMDACVPAESGCAPRKCAPRVIGTSTEWMMMTRRRRRRRVRIQKMIRMFKTSAGFDVKTLCEL